MFDSIKDLDLSQRVSRALSIQSSGAGVVKLANTSALGADARKSLGVRVPPPALGARCRQDRRVLALVEGIIEWLGPIFEGGVGYILIAVAVLLERSILIGLVIPGDVVLAIGGIFSARGTLE